MSVTAGLSDLRHKLVILTEQHNETQVKLQQRDKELSDVQERLAEELDIQKQLESEVELLKGKAEHQERRARLLEREVGYCKAMLVSQPIPRSLTPMFKASNRQATRPRKHLKKGGQ